MVALGRIPCALGLGQNIGKLASENFPLHPAACQPFPSTASHFLVPLTPPASHQSLVGIAKWAEQQPSGPRLDDEA